MPRRHHYTHNQVPYQHPQYYGTQQTYHGNQQTHYRMQLNNLLARNGRHLTWSRWEVGPHNQTTWHAIAYINGVEYGRGQGTTQGAAREEAARRSLRAIHYDQAIAVMASRFTNAHYEPYR